MITTPTLKAICIHSVYALNEGSHYLFNKQYHNNMNLREYLTIVIFDGDAEFYLSEREFKDSFKVIDEYRNEKLESIGI